MPTSSGDRSPHRKYCPLQIIEHDVCMRHLPSDLSGFQMVQMSDLHRRGAGSDELISLAVHTAISLQPDCAVITGDFVDGSARDIEPVVELLRPLAKAVETWAILGNHDHRGDPEKLTRLLRDAGLNVLHNQAASLRPRFWLAGTDDLTEGQGDLAATLSQLPTDQAAILLCHNPNGLDWMKSDRELVILAGHTHGAQIVLPFPSPSLVCRLRLHTPYVHGWYHNGNRAMYVNRGIGSAGARAIAFRFRCPPELTLFTLRTLQIPA